MSSRARLAVPALLVVGVVAASIVLSGGLPALPSRTPANGASPGAGGDSIGGLPTERPAPTPVPPLGGTELFGYLPYWQMTGSMAGYLRDVPLTTIGLFSVTARRTGAIDDRPQGHRRITGPLGRRIIEEAHERGVRVELVFTSFGADRNAFFFRPRLPAVPSAGPGSGAPASVAPPTAGPEPWRHTVGELVALAVDLGLDGINVDVELLDEADRDAYGEFLFALRAAVVEAIPGGTVSVATEAGPRGVGNAVEATEAGIDRLFLMGYDYHWSGSQPGASSPVERADGLYDLRWSVAAYVEAGVPRDRILLGLPMYGMRWRTVGPDRTSAVVGEGVAWIPSRNLDVVNDPGFAPGRDQLEVVEFYAEPDGNEWLLTYFDSPATARAKLAFARDQGLAGAGFWAIGYERGVPGWLGVMGDFREGRVDRSEAPQPE